ncbi:hypothetical protein QN362_18830, partial [Actimicrobium sp. CCC2.4]|nr:hypothetical protein [Actimicrobium sp. CCC2.4]
DGAIVIAGYFIAGTGAVIAAKEIFKVALLMASAKCEADLQKAGDTLANGLVTALGAGAALAGTPQLSGAAQALRTERVQGLINRVFKRSRASPTSTEKLGFETSNLQNKLEGYLLNPDHPQNQTKANWFQQALGFNRNNWKDLAAQLKFDENTAVLTKANQFGKTFEQTIPITGANGKIINTRFVFIKNDDGIVRLVTGIPTKK